MGIRQWFLDGLEFRVRHHEPPIRNRIDEPYPYTVEKRNYRTLDFTWGFSNYARTVEGARQEILKEKKLAQERITPRKSETVSLPAAKTVEPQPEKTLEQLWAEIDKEIADAEDEPDWEIRAFKREGAKEGEVEIQIRYYGSPVWALFDTCAENEIDDGIARCQASIKRYKDSKKEPTGEVLKQVRHNAS